MKKADKMNLLCSSKGTYNLCRTYFNYDPNYWYFYILDYSDKLLLCVEEDDFILDGFQIRKISDLKKIEIKDDICPKINEENNLLADVKKPQVDLTSWRTVFKSLKGLDVLMIVENEKGGDDSFFYLGYVREIKSFYVTFSYVDADGEWHDGIEIHYSQITALTFNDRYSSTWQKYLNKNKI